MLFAENLIEKKIPIPDFCVLRNEGKPDEEKITLTQLLNERMLKMDEHQLQIKQEILDFLKANGNCIDGFEVSLLQIGDG